MYNRCIYKDNIEIGKDKGMYMYKHCRLFRKIQSFYQKFTIIILKYMYLNADVTRKIVKEAFRWYEIEQELRKIGRIGFRFFRDVDRDGAMKMVEFISGKR